MGAHTLIHKRTENDIWKNLFELPLIETEKDLSEEEFLACPQFHALFAEGEVRMVRTLLRGVKHVLSHRVIYTNFYEVTLPIIRVLFQVTSRLRSKIWTVMRCLG